MKEIKNIIKTILYYLAKKPYKLKLFNDSTSSLLYESDKHYFYGYYDRSPENNGRLLFHEMSANESEVNIVVMDISTKKRHIVGKSRAFNWQMGARAIWIDDDIISYNDYDGNKYVCIWYSLKKQSIVKFFNIPLQDIKGKNYYLGVNYQRLRSYAKEYAYYCLPEMTTDEFDTYSNDGIWHMDISNNHSSLLLSISDILSCDYKKQFDRGKHFVNHIMIAPSGQAFIFIHRYYINDKRYDRLMYYDFKSLKCLMSEPCQSHYCWLDDNTIFGYGEHNGKKGFYEVDVNSVKITKHSILTSKHPRDGHPTVFDNWIVVDDYPNFSRMQSLTAYNRKTKEIRPLGEFFHDLQHYGFNRCDLHPRFSNDGKNIYIDTIYSGNRLLLLLDVNL